MHRQRIYIDTSVAGRCLDEEFNEVSNSFFDMVRQGEIILILSDLLYQELEDAPRNVLKILESLPPESYIIVTTTPECEVLRQEYMAARILGESSEDDALHVAIATVHKADLVVSWNFKHIVNVDKIRRFNAVNLTMGYQTIDIRSPQEVVRQ